MTDHRLDRIELKGLQANGFHGVCPDERRNGQLFVVDAVLSLDTRTPAASDDVADTVDYGRLARDLVAVVRGEPVDLIETLADRLAQVCLAEPRVVRTRVTVHKPQAPIAEAFDDVSVTVHRRREHLAGPVAAVLALGSNIGDRMAALQSAVDALGALSGVELLGVSPVVQTAPVGGPPGQQDYLNAVLRVDTGLTAEQLLAAGHGIEAALGRRRTRHWGSRTLDIDLICFGDLRRDGRGPSRLALPHPRAAQRAFVLVPWARLDPQAWLPGAGAVTELAEQAPDRSGVRERTDLVLELPAPSAAEQGRP